MSNRIINEIERVARGVRHLEQAARHHRVGVTSASQDVRWMRRALALATQAGGAGEVPVGAVLVDADGDAIGEGMNTSISANDPSAHAEIQALRAGALALGNHRLPGTTLYVTIEPCMMCAGALVHARVGRLVYGAREPKAGAVHTHALLGEEWLNHRVDITAGVEADACGELMSNFFSNRRSTPLGR